MEKMTENYHKWYSQYLSRDFEMLVFGSAGIPVILFPTEKGRYFDAKDFGIISSAGKFIEERKIKIYCPDSFDNESWYNYNIHPSKRIENHLAYEALIIKDVIEFAKHEMQSQTVVLAGISFGGYHALNLAFKHPEIVSGIISLSGFFDITRFIFGYESGDSYFNNPFYYMPNLEDEWYLNRIRKMKIILGTGDKDFVLDENINMSSILKQKEIEHQLYIHTGASHDWHSWREMLYSCLSSI